MKSSDLNKKNKIIIKPFKKQIQIPENFEIISWNKLSLCIQAIFYNTSINESKEELYNVNIYFIRDFIITIITLLLNITLILLLIILLIVVVVV